MKISTRLTLSGVVLVTAVALMAVVLVSTTQTVRQELSKNEGAGRILDRVFSIRYLMQEYVLQHEERAQVQWYLREASLASLLSAQATFTDIEDETLIRLRKSNGVVKSLFSQIVENHLASLNGDPKTALFQELEDRLTGQVMIRLEAMISDASTLSELSRIGVLTAQGRQGMAVLIFSGVILLIFAISILVTFKSVLHPLARLRAGAIIVGSGDFSFRLDDTRRDEVGDLARVFNEMAEALKGRDTKIRRLVDSSIIGIVISDLEGEVLEANDAFLTLVGYDRLDLKNGQVDWKSITPTDFKGLDIQALRELKERGTCAPFEKDYLRKDGRRIPVMIGCVLLEGTPANIVSFVLDLSERKAAQEALARTQADLTHVARVSSLGALTASVAHEVNQPLSGIITNASTCLRMLADDPPNIDGARETARRTIRDGNRASAVVKRLHALFAKKDAAMEALDLNEATSEVIFLLRSELQKSRAILRAELADDLPPVIGDRVQLQQVILNLLMNAADAMNNVDSRPRQLVVRTERVGSDGVCLAVQDAGVGFDPQGVERLFDAFYTTKNGGMGIGLFVSRTIIAGHGGRLWGSKNDGPGATFSFAIPCVICQNAGRATPS
jgi:PAS domain S-box-containing protein